MALEIKLTDTQIRPSKEFIEFLYHIQSRREFQDSWFDQLSERLKSGGGRRVAERFEKVAGQAIDSGMIQRAVLLSYEYTVALLLGQLDIIGRPTNKRFILVVGCPRSGGSYLTKQLYLALGVDPAGVPGLLAHDGFPKAWPFYIGDGHNQHTDMARYFAEYFVMLDLFFREGGNGREDIVVPKKDLNAAYHGAFYNHVLGPKAEFILTLRHPVACCISTYEKSGGLPLDGRFTVRSTIERFMQRDLEVLDGSRVILQQSDYFDVYLRYWELYHYSLALSGLCRDRKYRVIPYGKEHMEESATSYFRRFGSKDGPEEFRVFDKKDRHREWYSKAEMAMVRVADVWKTAGLRFPLEALHEGW